MMKILHTLREAAASITRHRTLTTALSALLVLVCFYLLLSGIDLQAAWNSVRAVAAGAIALAVLIFVAIRGVWAWQMAFVFRRLGMPVTTGQVFRIHLASTFYSFVLPGSMMTGEAISWYRLARVSGNGAMSVSVQVYLGALNALTLFAVGFTGSLMDTRLFGIAAQILFGVGLLVLALPFVPLVSKRAGSKLEGPGLRGFLQRIPDRAGKTIHSLIDAIGTFTRLRWHDLILVFALSFVAYVLGSLMIYVLAHALGTPLSLWTIGWLRTLDGAIQMVPFSVGGLGVRELGMVAMLQQYGIQGSIALSISFLIFVTTLLGAAVGGVLELWRFLRRLRHKPAAV